MIDGSDRVEFGDVEVIGYRGLLLKCRVGKKSVRVPLLRMLPGTTVALVGDRGTSSSQGLWRSISALPRPQPPRRLMTGVVPALGCPCVGRILTIDRLST